MPMIAELPVVMLACARIGAIHMMVFGGFSAEALKARIDNCGAKVLICADKGHRGAKTTPSKTNADVAISGETTVEKVIVVKRVDGDVPMTEGRDVWYHDEMAAADITADCPPVPVDAEHPLFILYTSGSTGTPKGVLHSTGGYLLYVHDTAKYVFNLHDDDIHFCTADIGWITGHSYIVYGPLACGVTSLLFEGLPTYPQPDRYWQVVEKHNATTVYTAPTVIRSLIGQGDEWPDKHHMTSLRVMGSVGEPIDANSWIWYYEKIGKGRIPLCDTWWQTETGGLMITPLPGASTLKPASANRPFFGVQTQVLKDDGTLAGVGEDGHLVITAPWPGMIRGTWGDVDGKRFKEVYFSMFKGVFTTGDGCAIDADGDHWLKGRIDDVLNVSGHRIGTSDVEGALVSYPEGGRGRRGRLPAPHQGHRHLRLRDPQRRRGAERRPQEGARRARPQGRGPHRDAGQDAVRDRPAQDPLRQDHAPHPAQDRRGRVRRPGRHLHAGRPGRRRGAQGQPPVADGGPRRTRERAGGRRPPALSACASPVRTGAYGLGLGEGVATGPVETVIVTVLPGLCHHAAGGRLGDHLAGRRRARLLR